MSKRRVLIMGAAGRDFHNFNLVYRDNPDFEVVAFRNPDPNIRPRLLADSPPASTRHSIYSESELPALILPGGTKWSSPTATSHTRP
jgi:predicted GTPase